MYNIGVIGCGIVGTATIESFKESPIVKDIYEYDKFKPSKNTLFEIVKNSEIIFICIPTPTTDYKQDISAIIDVITDISKYSEKSTIVIRSTVLPGTCRSLSELFPTHNIISNPEFLIEKNYLTECKHPYRIIIGGSNNDALEHVYQLHKHTFDETIPIFICTCDEAELTKYASNLYLATKVIYSNMIYENCVLTNSDWNKVREMWIADPRIGSSHTKVPGNNDEFGYSGTCFPKDMQAFIGWLFNNYIIEHYDFFRSVEKINYSVRNISKTF